MLTVSLKAFITTGRFGPIGLGSTIEQVKEAFGAPEQWTGPDFTKGHGIITYAWYEFFYYTDTRLVYGIQNDHLSAFPNTATMRVNNKRDICFTNDKFTIDIWFLKKNRLMTYQQVVTALAKEGIGYTSGWYYDGVQVRLDSGVKIDFFGIDEKEIADADMHKWRPVDTITSPERYILSGITHFDLNVS